MGYAALLGNTSFVCTKCSFFKNGNKGGTHIDSLYECSEYGFIQDD